MSDISISPVLPEKLEGAGHECQVFLLYMDRHAFIRLVTSTYTISIQQTTFFMQSVAEIKELEIF